MTNPRKMSREELEEEILHLRKFIETEIEAEDIAILMGAFGLTYNQARLTLALYQAKRPVTRARALAATMRIDHTREVAPKAVDVVLSIIRAKIGGRPIQHFVRVGWALTEEGRAKIGAVLNPPPA